MRRFSASIPKNAPNADSKIVNSKVIGMFAGRLKTGLPLIGYG